MARKQQSSSWIGVILAAISVGLFAGIILVNPYYKPPVGNSEVDPKDVAYDHALGAIPKVGKAKVTHILVSWKGKNARVTPKDPNRTEAQAKKLAEEIWATYKAASDADKDKIWKELQKEHNEDSGDVHNTYDVTPNAGLDAQFKEVSLTTAVNKVRITMPAGDFGYHVIRRIE